MSSSTSLDSKQQPQKDPPELSDICIGTAGYSYAHWRKGVFYPNHVTQANELRHFSGTFAAVEINASFHGVPREETLQTWAQKAKAGFQFSFKVPQEITHIKRLENMEESLSFFVNRLQTGLFNKNANQGDHNNSLLGPILFQLPPSLSKNVEKLQEIARLMPPSMKVAFEFRNQSWYCEEVFQTMQQHNFGLCENISPDNSTCHTNKVTSKTWHYIRLHKQADRGVTMYTDQQLASIADQWMARRQQGIVQYCYFLNDHDGNGPRNAQTLMKILKERSKGAPFVQNWKPDPVSASIQSLFAKSSNTTKTSTTSIPKPPSTRKNLTKRATPTMQSFFSPAVPSAKRPKLAAATRVVPQTKPSSNKKGSIANFFSKKST